MNSREEKEVRTAIIEKVKQNPSEWRIEQVNVRYQTGPFPYGDEMGKYYWDIFLIHQSAQIELKKQGREGLVLKQVDYGKMHYQRGFSEKEWEELEALSLGNNEIHANIPQNNSSENKGGGNPNSGGLGIYFLVGAIILGIFGIIFWKKIRSLF